MDEHLETSGVGVGKRSMMMVKDLPGELEATVAREKQHVRWSLRHQPASSCLAVYYGRRQDVQDVGMGGKGWGGEVMESYELSKIIGKDMI